MFSGISTAVKLGALCVLLALLGIASTYGAWKWQGANIATEVKKAEDAKDEQIAQERATTKEWRDKAEQLSKQANEKKAEAKVVHATATQAVKVERAAKPEFYEQEVPDGGIKQWEAARKLMQ